MTEREKIKLLESQLDNDISDEEDGVEQIDFMPSRSLLVQSRDENDLLASIMDDKFENSFDNDLTNSNRGAMKLNNEDVKRVREQKQRAMTDVQIVSKSKK